MKLLSRLLPWFVVAWLAGAAIEATAAASGDLQAIPPFSGPVVDRARLLDASQAAQLDHRLREFARTHGSQIAVLIVPTTQPESIEQYSIRVFDAWKIGRKKENDGVLITVATQDRKLRIDTGYGLEGAIPDAVAKRIVMETISPKFRGGDPYGGLTAGIEQIGKLIEGEQLPPPASGGARSATPQHAQGGDDGGLGQMLVPGIVAATIVGGILSMILGRFFGSIATAGIVGALAWVIGSSLFIALVSAILVFFYVLITGGHVSGWGGGGGWSGGGGGGWSGGGGGAGGGGASGDW